MSSTCMLQMIHYKILGCSVVVWEMKWFWDDNRMVYDGSVGYDECLDDFWCRFLALFYIGD